MISQVLLKCFSNLYLFLFINSRYQFLFNCGFLTLLITCFSNLRTFLLFVARHFLQEPWTLTQSELAGNRSPSRSTSENPGFFKHLWRPLVVMLLMFSDVW